jgi:hypothetical protein
MAATSHPQATLAAIEILKAGGNAVDAAIAAVAVQGVVESQMTGIGGDCFALCSVKAGAPIALNGSGRTPAKTDIGRYTNASERDIPPTSPEAVTVPGAIDAWCRLIADHGSKPLKEILFVPCLFGPGQAAAGSLSPMRCETVRLRWPRSAVRKATPPATTETQNPWLGRNASLLSGASLHAAQWIANADDPAATSKRAVEAFKTLLDGLLIESAKPSGR